MPSRSTRSGSTLPRGTPPLTTSLQAKLAHAPDARLARVERDLLFARGEAREARESLAKALRRVALLEHFESSRDVVVPPWTQATKRQGLYHATPGLMLSDLHCDEVVDPAQVEGLNAFNREIAKLRLRECFDNTLGMARHFLSGVRYDGFTLILGGDIFSGDIHEELTESNEDTLPGSLLCWIEELSGFILGLADEFGRVHVVSIAGNHGRLTRKPRAKFYVRDNFDWLLACLLRRELRKDARLTWNIPESRDAELLVYTTRMRITHGDEARGGSGISGKQTPLALLDHRKTRRITQSRQLPYDVLLYGHWHEFDPGERRLGNGSLKGIDEFSMSGEFGFEEPKQAFWLVTPEHGVSLKAPIYCARGRKAEKW